MLRTDNQGLRRQKSAENIGARSFDIVMKRVVDELSFEAPEKKGQSVTVDADYVRKMLTDIVKDQEFRRPLPAETLNRPGRDLGNAIPAFGREVKLPPSQLVQWLFSTFIRRALESIRIGGRKITLLGDFLKIVIFNG